MGKNKGGQGDPLVYLQQTDTVTDTVGNSDCL